MSRKTGQTALWLVTDAGVAIAPDAPAGQLDMFAEPAPDQRRKVIRETLARRYRGAVPVTDEMIDAVLTGLDGPGT